MADLSTANLDSLIERLSTQLDDLDHSLTAHHNALVAARSEVAPASRALLEHLFHLHGTVQALRTRIRTQIKQRDQLLALQEVSAMCNSSLELGDVLASVMDAIIRLTGAERGFLMMFDEQHDELEVMAARNMDMQTIGSADFQISRSIVDSVVESGDPVVTTDAQDDPRFAGANSIISYNIRSILCVPLKNRETITGVLYADNRISAGIFSATDRDLLASFANQAAVAVENARLFQQIRAHLANIIEMKNLMDDVFESIQSGVITLDQRDRISLFNRAAAAILGVDHVLAYNKRYEEVLGVLQPHLRSLVEQTKSAHRPSSAEIDVVLERDTSAATLNVSCSPLLDDRREMQGITVVVDDLSAKRRLDSARRYLPPALVDRIRDIDAARQPQRREVCVLFADIRGFSTFSESVEPEALVEVINSYFTIAAQAISEHEGIVDKFMGDAVMAVFNTTLNPQTDHVWRAVTAAHELQSRVANYHQTLPESERLFFGVGVHVGEAVVGNVGSPIRKDYSAIGDSVNLAKRLQETASPGQILISKAVFERVQPGVQARFLGQTQVKGRQTVEQIFELHSVGG